MQSTNIVSTGPRHSFLADACQSMERARAINATDPKDAISLIMTWETIPTTYG